MNDYFVIISKSDSREYSEIKNKVTSLGKSFFIPSVEIDSNDIYGIKIFEELQDSNEVLIVQTPYLQEDEKAMDLVFLAHSLEPKKIKIWEPKDFKISHELKSYVKKSPKFDNLDELLGIKEHSDVRHSENEIISKIESKDISYETERNNSNQVITSLIQSPSQVNYPESSKENSFSQIIKEEKQGIFTFSNQINNDSLKIESAYPYEKGSGNTQNIDKFSDIKFSFDDKGNLLITLKWLGQANEDFLIKVFVKKANKNNLKEGGRINEKGRGEEITSTCKIESYKLPTLTHDKVNGIDIQIELQKLKEGVGYVVIDIFSKTLNVYHYFNFFSKSINEIRD